MRNRRKTLALAAATSLIPGCAALYQPIVDHAVDRALEKVGVGAKDLAGDFVHDMANRPAPVMPPPGAGLWEYAAFGGMTILGGAAIFVKRKYFKKRRSN
jgi:hypothetical protein